MGRLLWLSVLLLMASTSVLAHGSGVPDCAAVRRSLPPGYVLQPGPCSDAPPHTAEPPSAPDPASIYLQQVMGVSDACRVAGGDAMDCYVKASPQRCKQTAIQFVSELGEARRTWAMCVRSCAASGFYASHFGDCRK